MSSYSVCDVVQIIETSLTGQIVAIEADGIYIVHSGYGDNLGSFPKSSLQPATEVYHCN